MTMIGTLGQAWRGRVTPWGDVEVPGAPPLAWFVAADDGWRHPARETSTRQRRVGGAPVVETKLRVPGGAVVHTVWCSADRGGMTFVMVRNDSPLPIAVAFSRGDLWLPRPPTDVPIEGIELPAGSVGEIAIAHQGVAQVAFWRRPELEAEVIRDGWFYTGDLGRFDANGFLYIVGRNKDMIISGGFNVYAREVEEALLSHPEVADAAVLGLPDAQWGEMVAAVVVLRQQGQVDAAALQSHCGERIAGYKKPRRIVMAQELPRNAAGKVVKACLKDLFER